MPQSNNQIIEGVWWTADDQDERLFSIEQGIADTLRIKLNDDLVFRVADREVKGTVSNIRFVEWDSFNVNFFVIANPELLEASPATYITSFHLSAEHKPLLNELIKRFPSITILDVDALMEQARQIINRGATAVEYVFVFTLLTGLVVLFAGIQATHDERIREIALLRTLGATTSQLVKGLVTEFTCLGLFTGLLAAVAASICGYVLATHVFNIDYQFNPWLLPIGLIIGAVGIGVAGIIGTRSALQQSPIATLRQI